MARLRLSVILLLLCIVSSIARTQLALSQQISAFSWETVPKTTARDLLIQKFEFGPKWLEDPVAFAQLIPREAELSFLSGLNLMRRNHQRKAIKCFSEIIAAHPHCYPALICEGNAYFHLHEYVDALALFEEAQRCMPNISDSYESEGCVYYRQNQ